MGVQGVKASSMHIRMGSSFKVVIGFLLGIRPGAYSYGG